MDREYQFTGGREKRLEGSGLEEGQEAEGGELSCWRR
jgi:hypothetical protein